MQVENRLLDDLARVATGAVGALTGIRAEVEGQVRQQFERILAQMDVPSREEFEAVKAVAAQARSTQEELSESLATVDALKAEVARLESLLKVLADKAGVELPAPAAAPARDAAPADGALSDGG